VKSHRLQQLTTFLRHRCMLIPSAVIRHPGTQSRIFLVFDRNMGSSVLLLRGDQALIRFPPSCLLLCLISLLPIKSPSTRTEKNDPRLVYDCYFFCSLMKHTLNQRWVIVLISGYCCGFVVFLFVSKKSLLHVPPSRPCVLLLFG